MKKSELLEKIKAAKDDEDINSLLKGTDVEEQFKQEPTLEVFKQKVKADKAFQQFMDSERDAHHSKVLKTMKEKGTWESEFAEVLTQKYPDLVTDPMKKQLLEVQKELATAKAEAAREKLLTQAIAYASEKKLPTSFVEKFLGEDLDSTKTNLDAFANDWSKGLESIVNEKMKASSYVPGGSNPDGTKISIGAAMAAQNNKSNTAPSNPWAKE